MNSGIYEIQNKVNGKRYIGSAVDFRQRFKEHKSMLGRRTHHSKHLQNSWDKHGSKAFVFNRLVICRKEHLLFYEQRFLDRINPEYNVCPVAGNTMGRKHSEETKRKISEKAIGRKQPPRSEEYRKKISQAHKGRPKQDWHMEALQAGRAKRVYDQDQRLRISEKLKEQYRTGVRTGEKSPEYRNKISRTLSKLTDEQVREIRKRSAEGETGASLSREFGSPASTISQIIRMKRYRWVN